MNGRTPCRITDGPQTPEDIPKIRERDEDQEYENWKKREIDQQMEKKKWKKDSA